jgi:hypothetical protein
MKTEKSNLMVFATIAAIVAVIGNFIAAAVLLQTKSNSWLIFSALAVGASLLAAYVTLTASQKQSLEASRTKARVFLSYAREDEEQVDALYRRLQKEGLEPWMDVKRLTAGENWISAIEQAVEDTDFFLALISKNSIDKRGFIQREMKFTLDLLGQESRSNIHVIPALLDDTAVPEPLKTFHRVNLFEEKGFSELLDTLKATSESIKMNSSS